MYDVTHSLIILDLLLRCVLEKFLLHVFGSVRASYARDTHRKAYVGFPISSEMGICNTVIILFTVACHENSLSGSLVVYGQTDRQD
jgi:hypothetical protein